MVSQTEIKANLNYSLIISEEMLKRIDKWGDESLYMYDIECECRDEAIRHFANVEDLLKYENEKERKIVSTKFYIKDETSNNSILLHLNGDNEFESGPRAWFRISGNEAFCDLFRGKIKREIKSCRSWYWLIEMLNFAHPVFAILGVTLGGFLTYSLLFDFFGPFQTEEKISKTLYGTFVLLGAILSVITVIYVNIVKQIIFPRITFAVGFEIERNKFLEKIRWGGACRDIS